VAIGGVLTLIWCLSLFPTWATALTPDEVPVIAIPRITTPPTIDGNIDSVEWREAVAISGVANQSDNMLVPRPTTYYLAWDPGHFYLAFRTYIRPGYKPTIPEGRSPGLASVFDDTAELVCKPMGKNVPVNNQQAAYKFMLNCLGMTGDMCKLDLGQMLKNWAPKFVTAAHLTAPGSAPNGGRWCEVEMSTTPADFELTGEHRVGDEWRLMLGFDHLPGWMQARIPCMSGYFEATGNGYCRATLVENTPAVQMTMDSLANLAVDGTAALQLSAYNPARTETRLAVDVDIAGTVVKHDTLILPASGNGQYDLNEKLPSTVKDGKASIRVSQNGRLLLTYTTCFNVGALNWMLAPVQQPDPKKFTFQTRFNPVRSWLLIKGDTYYLPDPARAKSLSYRVIPKAGGKILAQGTLTRVADWYFQERLQLPPLSPGLYTVEASMHLDDGTTLGPMSATVEKKD